jgi:hypothetical protein
MLSDDNELQHLGHLVTQRRWLAIIIFISAGLAIFLLSTGKELPGASIFAVICLCVFVAAVVTFIFKKLREPILLAEGIKGLRPFIEDEHDAKLLDKLGRHADISNLRRDTLDEQIHLLVLKGKPGCGKSSVLRAGIKWAVQQQLTDKEICYWQAAPEAIIDDLIAEVNKTSAEFKQVLQTLLGSSASAPPATADHKLRILIIDHFDFLRPDYGRHQVFFDLLERLCNNRSPHKLKCIIAFRNEYWPNWHAIQQKLGATASINEALLEPLPINVAGIVMRKILIRAGIDAGNASVKRFLVRLAEGPEIQSVWVGVGTEVFSRWALSSPWRFVSQSRYLQGGGVKGVIAEHLQYHFREVAPNHSGPLLNAVSRSLIDNGKRNMSGAKVDGMLGTDGMTQSDIASYLRGLTASNRRILERVDSRPDEERYRLAQEQFAEIIPILDDQPPAEAYKLEWSFTEQFEHWHQSKKRLRYLLDGKHIRAVKRHKDSFKGPDPLGREDYFNKSLWMYRFTRAAFLIAVVGLIFAGYEYHEVSDANYYGQLLKQWHLPPELYIKQKKLDALHIHSPSMQHLQWLKSNQLNELEINSWALSSLDGITKAPHLNTLTLNVAYSPIKDLSPLGQLRDLNNLILFVGGTHNVKLTGLSALDQLHTLRLSLDNSTIDVGPLSNLPRLTTVRLDLQGSRGQNISSITQFKNVEDLSINLRDSSVRQLPDFPQMHQLTTLTLNLENSGVVRLGALQSLHSLRSLSINLKDSTGITDLPDISTLTELESLDLNLEGSNITQLPGLEQLTKLNTLSLHLARSAVVKLPDLVNLPKLQNLTLDLTSTRIRTLPVLGSKPAEPKRGYKSLALKLQSLSDSDLQKLRDLLFIRRLDLDITSSSNASLPELKDVAELHDLTIHVNWPQLRQLPALPELTHLTVYVQGALPADLSAEAAPLLLEPLVQLQTITALTLYLDDSLINLPRFGQSDHLNTFELHMKRVPIKALNNLADLKELRTLCLDLEYSSSLESLPGLNAMTHLHEVSLKLRGTSIQDLFALSAMTELVDLNLDISSKTTALPYLNSQSIRNITVDMDDAPNLSLTEVAKLVPAKELTVNRDIGKISELPPSISKLNLGRLIPVEDSSQPGCIKPKQPPAPQ